MHSNRMPISFHPIGSIENWISFSFKSQIKKIRNSRLCVDCRMSFSMLLLSFYLFVYFERKKRRGKFPFLNWFLSKSVFLRWAFDFAFAFAFAFAFTCAYIIHVLATVLAERQQIRFLCSAVINGRAADDQRFSFTRMLLLRMLIWRQSVNMLISTFIDYHPGSN